MPLGRPHTYTRREFLLNSIVGGAAVIAGPPFIRCALPRMQSDVFIAQATTYQDRLVPHMLAGFQELGVTPGHIKGKRILLKPNLVESHAGASHINTHPLVIQAAIESFRTLGAGRILVAEGPGHRRDTLHVLEESGMADVVATEHTRFIDLNLCTGFAVSNAGNYTSLETLTFPEVFRDVDWIVSVAKLKTHHWAGATLSMKNLFGVMPGMYYGWPKNVLHGVGIHQSILDINATLKPQFAIVDGIIGMEGDGPIMGTPVQSGVLIMGTNLPAVDATCCRIMGINPEKIPYLSEANTWLGPIEEYSIKQVGEPIVKVRRNFALLDKIPAHKAIRLES